MPQEEILQRFWEWTRHHQVDDLGSSRCELHWEVGQLGGTLSLVWMVESQPVLVSQCQRPQGQA